MKDKYQIVILYTYYDSYLNLIKAEEAKGNIEVVCIGTDDPQWKIADGWLMTDTQSALLCQWDYLLYAGAQESFITISKMLQRLPFITQEKVLPIGIFEIPNFDFKGYVRLIESKISIISSHCWGGISYHYFHMQFSSPFINMFVKEDEYLKLLENLEYYMELKVEYAGEEYGDIQKRYYPVGKIGDIHLHFNHYYSFEEAVQKWEERKKRLNMDNLFVQMSTASSENAERFDLLPYKNKIVFVPRTFGLESEINLECFNDLMDREGIKIAHIANQLAEGRFRYYDVIKLLNGEKDCIKCIK